MEQDALQLSAGQQLEVASFYRCGIQQMNPTNVWGSCFLFFGVNKLIFGQTWVLSLWLVT